MSARDEREPLGPRPTSLYDHALFVHAVEPDAPLPRAGRPLPDGSPPESGRKGLTWERARADVTAALTDLLADPDPVRAAGAVHRRVSELAMPHRTLRAATALLPLTDEDAARRTARRLTRTGTDAAAVGVGITLLIRLGEPEDVPCLQALGTLRGLEQAAAAALDPLDRQAAALLVIRRRDRSRALAPLTAAITAGDPEAVRDALIAVPDDPRALWLARRVAEAADLDALLRSRPGDTALIVAAGRLLHGMCGQLEHRPDILDYLPARSAYAYFLGQAGLPDPAPELHELLLSTALDLHSGPAALLDWRPFRREALLDRLERLLAGPAWDPGPHGGGRRADWIRRTGRKPFARTAAAGAHPRWEVAVVQESPDSNRVETRILVDGRPLLPALFGKGPGGPPEDLLDSGLLRAGPRPREVRLAEADCTEGCCGALYVTIRRDGPEVVWGGWRGAAGPPPPEYRFDAAAYDAEVERAEKDESWCWPARSAARLITAGLRERPELLGRWGLGQSWVSTGWRDPDTVTAQFAFSPPGAEGSLYFQWDLPDDGSGPQARAAAALERIAVSDPKDFAVLGGGSRELAESLGYDWPPPS
ncbi:hypothetical protein ABZZ17_37990 [Streptomyces sp. NPDC006512]|uniref:hypothetical protein n=1 Tax=Streptomyces sp. NPDC006512 TaxID=3154307 RepID=UPI00339EAAA8